MVNENFKAITRVEKFNDSSIDILIQVFTINNDWEYYLEAKEKLAFEIKKFVENNNCSFAFPSHSVYIEKE